MAYAGRHNIYEGTIRKMVTKALNAQEAAFREVHGSDTDEQLIAYLKEAAAQLKHSPWPAEIVGGTIIEERFGTWERALLLAGLPAPSAENKPNAFLRVKQEEQRQKEIYRKRKAEKKVHAEKRRAQQAAKKRTPAGDK